MSLDTRWKLPQGKTPDQLYDCLFSLIRELRKGDYLDGVSSPDLTGQPASNIAFTATQRVLGRNTAGAGDGEEVTLSQLLDWIGSAAQGDVLYRGSSAWARLGAGTSGQFLQTQGAGANPQWATPSSTGGTTTIASGSLSGSAVTITSIPATFAYIVLHVAGASFSNNNNTPVVRVSTNNGSSYDATLGNYPGDYWDPVGTTYQDTTAAGLIQAANMLSGDSFTCTVTISNYHNGPHKLSQFRYLQGGTNNRGRVWYVGATAAIDALQITRSAGTGNFDAGTYALYGIS
jgi:hypothetical protein